MAHAERELKLSGVFDKDSDYGGMIGESVMELVHVFSKQGHSGASAHMTIDLFKRVAAHENLTPLTGEEDEWNEVGEGEYQNKRVSSVFKGKDGRAYYLDAITWRTQAGSTWSGKADEFTSRQFIKSFPFTPKTFYVDVIEEEVAKDDWKFHIKDGEQLVPVAQYYDLITNSL